jgi:RHS repeat-associated protein
MAVVTKTVLGKAQIATRKSGHFAPGPPAANLGPPTPPAGPVPAPFLYIAKTATAHSGTLADETICKGATCLVASSAMDVERPGNMPTKPVETMGGADVVTHVVIGQARMLSGSARTTAKNGEKVCKTGDPVALNVPMPKSQLHQSEGVLMLGLMPGMSDAAKKRKEAEATRKAAIVTKTGDPVAVVSGEVTDDVVDLALPGMIPVQWSRHYRSRGVRRSIFGRGGWSHGFDTSVERAAGGFLLLDADGSEVPFGEVAPRGEVFDRASRLVLARGSGASFELRSLDTRLVRELSPVRSDGPAVLRAIRDAWGNRVELRYDDDRLSVVVDTAKRELRLFYDSSDRVTRVEVWARGAKQQSVSYAYGDGGELAAVTNALGASDRYVYDGAHRIVEKRLRGGLVVCFTYDDDGRCTKSTTPEGVQRVALMYDDDERTTLVHENPLPVLYTWDERGIVVRAETADGSSWSSYRYDDDLYLVEAKHSGGRTSQNEYDGEGNRVLNVDFAGRETTWEYVDGLVTKKVGPEGVTTCTYDPRGAMISITYPSGNTFTRTPDRNGRLVAVDGPEGRVLTLEHDAEHNVVKEIDARGATTISEYDALGRVVRRVDALGRAMQRQYDAAGRPVLQTFVDGTALRYEWDDADRLVRSTDAHGHAVSSEHTGTGVVAKRTLPDGQSWHFQHDILERVRVIRNPRAETCELAFDRAGHVIEQKTFDGRLLSVQYSAAGRVARVEHPDESWVSYARDPIGRIVAQASPDGTRAFAWTGRNNVSEASVEDPDGAYAVQNEADDHGRLVTSTQGEHAIKYEYDAMGRRSARVLPDGQTTRYYWDASGELSAIDHDGHKVLLQRDILGRLVRLYAYDSGLDVLLAYADNGRIATQEAFVRAPSSAQPKNVARRQFHYGPHARIAVLHDARWGTTTYEHDAAGRLLAARSTSFTELYEYDGAGYMRGAARGGGPPEAWSIAEGNVLLGTPRARMENDARHRRTRVTAADGSVTKLLWDAFDQLREVKRADGTRVCFRYDALGRRVEKRVIPPLSDPLALPAPPRVVRYLWDGDELAAEIDSERGTRVFVSHPGNFLPLMQIEGGQAHVCVTSHLGATRELVDETGRVVWAAEMSPWGDVISVARDEAVRASSVASPFRLLGQYHDDETGLCYTRHRYFDAKTMRWLSPDPLEIDGGGDLFGFGGSPTEQVDPLGLKSRTEMEEFLASTDKARAEAHAAAMNEQAAIRREIAANNAISPERKPFVESQCTSAASNPHEPGASAPQVGRNDPGGTGAHAETNMPAPLAGTAVGAGRPHCANCVSHIQAQGGVTASPIRSSGDAAWDPPPATPPGQKPTQDPAW